MNKICFEYKVLMLLILVFSGLSLFADSVTLSTDSDVVSAGEVFNFILSADGSFESITEPDFSNFDVENRSESQSNSVSVINGKIESRKSINFMYQLRARKAGVFKIGPASVKLKNGKKNDSNVVTVTVGSSDKLTGNSDENSAPTGNSLLAPLTSWEKKTPNFFLRAVQFPQGEIYEGEPLIVKYYLFVKPGAISDLNFYKLPSFENTWKEEKSESRLSWKRVSIDGQVYDYGLLKTYLLIPENGASAVIGTQMIVDIVVGSFFNTRKQSISTPALRVPLAVMPEKEMHPDGIFGDFEISVDKKSLVIDKDNLLETVVFSIKGCGNFQSAEINLQDSDEIKFFSPEVESNASDSPNGYCGEKRYKYMIKGLRKGVSTIKGNPLNFFSREKGWVVLPVPEIEVNVKEISVSSDSSADQKARSFELLKELPEGIVKHEISPIVERLWFKILLGIPFIISLLSFFIWLLRSFRQKYSKSFRTKVDKWEKLLDNSGTHNELLNNFYEALNEIFSLELRGERSHNIKKKHGDSVEELLKFIKEVEYVSYSGINDSNLKALKEKAKKLLDLRGKLR